MLKVSEPQRPVAHCLPASMTHWYTADTHFGHEEIIPACGRPFRSADQMDSILIENMWKVVKPEDDLWVLGDFSCGPKARDYEYLDMIFSHLPGARKHLIIGNHDCAGAIAQAWASREYICQVQDGPDEQRHTLCHYPMITWDGARNGALQLFGHVHNRWQGSRNSINVGVDQWRFTPVSLEQIRARAMTLPENLHWSDVEGSV